MREEQVSRGRGLLTAMGYQYLTANGLNPDYTACHNNVPKI